MKKVVACYKWVWDDADIRVDEKTRLLDFEKRYDEKILSLEAEILELRNDIRRLRKGK